MAKENVVCVYPDPKHGWFVFTYKWILVINYRITIPYSTDQKEINKG